MLQSNLYIVIEQRPENEEKIVARDLTEEEAKEEVSRLNRIIGGFSYYVKRKDELCPLLVMHHNDFG